MKTIGIRPSAACANLWAAEAPTGVSKEPEILDKRALPTAAFHVRFNQWDLRALQIVADLEVTSKQRIARRAIREYIENRLKRAGIDMPEVP